MNSEKLSTKRAAEHLGIAQTTLKRMVAAGQVQVHRKPHQHKSRLYFDKAHLDRLLQAGPPQLQRVRNNEKVDPDTSYTTTQVCQVLGIDRTTVRDWEKKGLIIGLRAHNRVYYDRTTIDTIREARN